MLFIAKGFWFFITQTLFRFFFGHVGHKTLVNRPLQINNGKSIFLENGVYIAQYAWLHGSGNNQSLIIKNRAQIGHFAHLIAMESVTIEENVLIADKVFITDCTHNYSDLTVPIRDQSVDIIKPVIIGEGSWIGENVCICGANVGKHSVIGANSVVKTDIPDYCVAVGCPAKIVKRYDFRTQSWMKV